MSIRWPTLQRPAPLLGVRQLKSGPALAAERVLGRRRYLAQAYDLRLPASATIDDALAEFEPSAGKIVHWPHPEVSGRFFLVDDLISDLRILRADGNALPGAWWRIDGADSDPDPGDNAALLFAVDAQVGRAQVLYDEIVRLNFAAVAASLPFHGMLPVRYKIGIERCNEAQFGLSISRIFMPVADWTSAGADLAGPSETVRPLGRSHYDAVASTLAQLGREPAHVVAGWSSGGVEHFDGYDWDGTFDGETAALRLACKWLQDDLNSLFASLPER